MLANLFYINLVSGNSVKMADNERAKKERDPIFTSCLIIFGIAVVMILGVYVSDHYLTSDDSKVVYGDEVEVEYVGSYYDYYDEDVAVIFDTNIKSIGDDDEYAKSNSYTTKTSYSLLKFTVGKGSMLSMFENAVVGLRVGDTTTVKIPVGEGYVSPINPVTQSMNGQTLPRITTMTKSDFTSLYSDVTLTPGVMSTTFATIYGWDAQATIDSTSQIVTVYYNPVSGTTYDYDDRIDDEDKKNPFGKVKFAVTAVSDELITFNWVFEDFTTINSTTGEIQMIELDFGGNDVFYVTAISGTTMTMKSCAERENVDLYFEITVKSVTSS